MQPPPARTQLLAISCHFIGQPGVLDDALDPAAPADAQRLSVHCSTL
jgi:hypothetical protein